MAAAAFSRFEELPGELQILVWSFAAYPWPDVELAHNKVAEAKHSEIFRMACEARVSLMGACRLSRQITLEMWKKDGLDARAQPDFSVYVIKVANRGILG